MHASKHIGELAICDGGSCKIHLLSPTMQFIQRISLPYVSPNDLPIAIVPVPGSRRNEKDNKQKQKKMVGVQKTNKNSSAGNIFTNLNFIPGATFCHHLSIYFNIFICRCRNVAGKAHQQSSWSVHPH